jgi:hypothetical protein
VEVFSLWSVHSLYKEGRLPFGGRSRQSGTRLYSLYSFGIQAVD